VINSEDRQPVHTPEPITGARLNSLSPDERISVLRGQFGRRMHMWAGSHVTFFRWATPSILGPRLNNGSAFFLDLGGRLHLVTAAHVYRGYLAAKRKAQRILCHVGNVEFDPERRLIGLGQNVDVATFDFSYDELRSVGKQALVVADPTAWPPPHPFPGQGAFLAGFPGRSRLWLTSRSVSFGLYVASPRVNSASDRQITCPFEREYWIDPMGHGLPPRGFDLGGISGGPMLIPMDTEGIWNFYLGGVISEASSRDFETVVSVPAHFIAWDGTIHTQGSVSLRHAVPATGTARDDPSSTR
jgi:hypothetical protein